MYGKATEAAIAVMSKLAESHSDPGVRLSAADLSTSRGLPGPFVSKVLSTLSTAGLVDSTRGPGGGFSLAKPPEEIRLFDVVSLFERDRSGTCPVGGGICGQGEPCPIHDRLSGIRRATDALLMETTFAVFRDARTGRKGGPRRTKTGRRKKTPSR